MPPFPLASRHNCNLLLADVLSSSLQVDFFQELEQDLDVRKRFEEAAAMELQQGWCSEKKTEKTQQRQSSLERDELQVQELLRRRPGTMMPRTEHQATGHELGMGQVQARTGARASGATERASGHSLPRGSIELNDMISRRFGSIRRD